MKKILIAVDEAKSSKAVLFTYYNLVQRPEEVVLLHVERLEGDSSMIDMLGEAEMKTLRESLADSEHRDRLSRKTERILGFYRKELEESGVARVSAIVRDGNPVEEILKVAREEGVDMILVGYSKQSGLHRLISGSVGKEVGKRADIPVLLAKMPTVCEEPYTWRDAYYAVSIAALTMFILFIIGITLEKSGALLP